jgi:hypothetical protein
MRAWPIRAPAVNRSSCFARSAPWSKRAESIAVVSVNRGAIMNASWVAGPRTNRAGPADESHVDGSGTTTAVVSGGGTTGTTVSFRADAGGVRSHARIRTVESRIPKVGLLTRRPRVEARANACPKSVQYRCAVNRLGCQSFRSLRHSTYSARYRVGDRIQHENATKRTGALIHVARRA